MSHEVQSLRYALQRVQEDLAALRDHVTVDLGVRVVSLEDRVGALEFLIAEEGEDELTEVDPVVEEAEELFDDVYVDELDEPRAAFVAGYLEGQAE